MGPRPDGRGTFWLARQIDPLADLQWGRDRMAAERSCDRYTTVDNAYLQWGRDRMAAERRRRASAYGGEVTLQWGRDRMAAERGPGPAGPAGGAIPSMGPRPDGRGTPHHPVGRSPSHPPSMGPRPDGRGTLSMSFCMGSLLHLQWGRDRMAAERASKVNRSRGHVAPSMGPRPDGRGTTSRARGRRVPNPTFNGAATGWPRNVAPKRWPNSGASSFNGAATGWPRNGRPSLRTPTAYCSLQWGRDRMAAERGGRAGAWPWPAASMGPRPDGRGTLDLCRRNCGFELLQWGRDRMAAERRSPRRHRQAPLHASMGPRPDGRGTATAMTSSAKGMKGFNGAATGWPRNGGGRSGRRPRGRRFNGAATGWPRNEVGRLGFWVGLRRASMGPRPDGRGTLIWYEPHIAPVPASMGPRPDGRGTLAAARRA